MFGPWQIPSVGEVQLSWLPNLPIAAPPATQHGLMDNKTGSDEDMMAMDTSVPADHSAGRKDGNHEVDYDVAEDEDTWE